MFVLDFILSIEDGILIGDGLKCGMWVVICRLVVWLDSNFLLLFIVEGFIFIKECKVIESVLDLFGKVIDVFFGLEVIFGKDIRICDKVLKFIGWVWCFSCYGLGYSLVFCDVLVIDWVEGFLIVLVISEECVEYCDIDIWLFCGESDLMGVNFCGVCFELKNDRFEFVCMWLFFWGLCEIVEVVFCVMFFLSVFVIFNVVFGVIFFGVVLIVLCDVGCRDCFLLVLIGFVFVLILRIMFVEWCVFFEWVMEYNVKLK